jgi:hypothetical protein
MKTDIDTYLMAKELLLNACIIRLIGTDMFTTDQLQCYSEIWRFEHVMRVVQAISTNKPIEIVVVPGQLLPSQL